MARSTAATSATGQSGADDLHLVDVAFGLMSLVERPVQLSGSALARGLLRLAGWEVRFHGLPAAQGVAVVYPHTSNWDFVVGVLAKWSVGLPLTFWGKDSLFRIPLFGRWLRWLGGRPVDRHASQGIVGQMAEEIGAAKQAGEFLWLALAPEGTRSRQQGWRSGFYHVALAAQVPVALIYIDYAEKVVSAERFVRMSGNVEADIAMLDAYLGRRVGRRPDEASPVRWNA